MAKPTFNAFQMAQEQFDKIGTYLALDKATCDLLRNPGVFPANRYKFSRMTLMFSDLHNVDITMYF